MKLKTASYKAPSGKTSTFDFETLSRTITHSVGSFQFSGVNGTLHQDRGIGGEVYPLAMYFHGQDYDKEADKFIDLVRELGPGTLSHPRWGDKKVQVLSISQSENLVTERGQSVIEVQFQETLEREFPLTSALPQAQLETVADEAQEFVIKNYEEQAETNNIQEESALEQSIILAGDKVNNALESVAAADQTVAAEFRSKIDSVLENANDYVSEPFEFAKQITGAIRVIAEIPGRITSKIQGYSNLLNALQLRDITGNQTRNEILIDEMLGTMAVMGASESINSNLSNVSTIARNQKGKASIFVPVVSDGFRTREEIMAAVSYLQTAAQELIDYLDESQEIFENNILSEAYIQSVQSYVPAWAVVGSVIKSAITVSFTLPVRRVKILEKSRTIIDLCYEFYKNIDDVALDYFILTNDLSGDEIIEVPMGKAVIFYE